MPSLEPVRLLAQLQVGEPDEVLLQRVDLLGQAMQPLEHAALPGAKHPFNDLDHADDSQALARPARTVAADDPEAAHPARHTWPPGAIRHDERRHRVVPPTIVDTWAA